MDLTAEQQDCLAQWVAQGMSLSEIQKEISDQWKISLTYMDVRFLVDDLDLSLQDREENKKPADNTGAGPVQGADGLLNDDGGVTVEVDKLVKPGTVVSGTVSFSDGEKADWQVDAMGRLGLVPARKGYKPESEDFMEFQTQLQNALQKQGF